MAEPVTLEEARLHLRVDHTDEDALIGSIILAARELAEHETGRVFSTDWPAGDVPASIRQWMLLTIGTLYANRETLVQGQQTGLPRPVCDGLLDPWRTYT